MEQKANRVLQLIEEWQTIESENRPYFAKAEAVARDKLKHYDRILSMFQKTNDPRERVTLNLVRGEIEVMEKQLYKSALHPWRLGRQVARFLGSLSNNQRWERDTALLKDRLPQELQRGGFSSLVPKVQKQLDLGFREFQVREHAYLNDDRIAHLNFRYEPGLKGPTALSTVDVVIPDNKQPGKEIRFSYDVSEVGVLDIRQLRNLASGRIVAVNAGPELSRSAGGTYMELVNGELHTVSARARIDQQVKDLPFNETQKPELQKEIIVRLRKGDQVEVTHAHTQERYLLHISKNTHEIAIMDIMGKIIPLKTIDAAATLAQLQQKQAAAMQQPKQHPAFGKQKTVQQSNQQVAL